ncbi:MAG: ATP-binding protein [Sedimentisphaerales bacterium]
MAAIPKTDLPGYEALRKRVDAAFQLLQESRAVDFKQSVKWEDYKIKFAETIMAMSNLRDGGIVIIGVSEENGEWKLKGITDQDLATYDPDNMIDFVNKYASPVANFNVVRHEMDGTNFLIMSVREFESEPVICKRDHNKDLRNGAIYIRPLGKPETRAIQNAEEMRELLDIAVEKKMRRLAGQMQYIYGQTPPTQQQDQKIFDQELGGL